MKKIMMAVVMVISASAAYAAPDFGDLDVSVNELKAASANDTAIVKFKAADKSADDSARLAGLSGGTAYKKLENLFKSGSPATKDSLRGRHVGRGVDSLNENRFMAAILIGKDQPDLGGPLFDSDINFTISEGYNASFPAAYDHLSYDELSTLECNLTPQAVIFPGAKRKTMNESEGLSIEDEYRVAVVDGYKAYIVQRSTWNTWAAKWVRYTYFYMAYASPYP
ncbi:MAG: hypothetical protein A2X28_01455 [Elusimicrobia bacterium GWA2_56_46]|nr:MAG: hypothetical protein A2X28_01455 [Elusimicrobia bacterium GWA2_56_46]OGR53823.1 MAG: hypothetical protein A2X39_06855 [Elusimicrobia bacterium GWC2_56_31]HBB66809.1 hypothetical protein [Elusimicrobiota bacterium]HBW22675.1 hypothetical protein [Elusimicrobiota bacterium]